MKATRILSLRLFLTAAVLSFPCLIAPAQDYRVLHHFTGGNNDGAWPFTSQLVQSGSTLYGVTPEGGSNNLGTVFRINTDGTDFEVLHSFVAASIDGSRPFGSLLLSGSTLYGMATSSDTTSRGTVFKLNTDGSEFQVVHSFTTNEGKWPYSTLIESGSMLYGLAAYGGIDNGSGWVGGGTMFRMNTNGTGFHVLHTFRGGLNDGWIPHGSLAQSGTNLFGTSPDGGIANGGTVFRTDINGSRFELLHRFTGSADGLWPTAGTLLVSGTTVYGMAREGGIANTGTVFRINTDGSGFQVLHHFTRGTNDGAWPVSATLVQSSSTLYGMTTHGGINEAYGTIFKINTNGSGFQLLHRFDGTNGREPWGSLLLSRSTLYGMTSAGGSNDLGVIFALDLLPKLAVAVSGTNLNLSWSTHYPGFVLEGIGQLTGAWTLVPGVTGYSATLPVNPETNRFFRLRK